MGSLSEYIFQRPGLKTGIKHGKFWSERGPGFEKRAGQVFLGALQTGVIVADKYYQASEMVYFICNSLTNFLTSAHTLVT